MTGRLPAQRFSANAAEAFAAHLRALDPDDARAALAPATPTSLTSEMLADRVALYDHALRSNVEAWRRVGTAIAGATRS